MNKVMLWVIRALCAMTVLALLFGVAWSVSRHFWGMAAVCMILAGMFGFFTYNDIKKILAVKS